MLQHSVGAGDGDSCAYNQGGKNCYMPQDSVDTEEGDSCDCNQGGRTGTCLWTA